MNKTNNNASEWEKVVTTRRYLHPPKSERLFTLWSEGKITFGEIIKCIAERSYAKLECSGLWFVYGEDDAQFDFKSAKQSVSEDATPVHTLTFDIGNTEISIEAFCDTERLCTCFGKVTVRNTTDKTVNQRLSVLLRSGKEKELIFGSPDLYTSYAPDVDVWKNMPSVWLNSSRNLYVDEDVFVIFDDSINTVWDVEKGAVRCDISLSAGEEKQFTLSFGKGKILDFDYCEEKKKTENFWKRELARLYEFPENIKNNAEMSNMIKHFTVQLLQCFCYHKGTDNLVSRQGGLQRLTWPGEFFRVLETLGNIGEFSDYIEPVLENCFENQQKCDGEIKPDGFGWASITGCILYSFSVYCLKSGKRFYNKYRENAYAAFGWIKRTRAKSVDAKGECRGIFPPMRASDWEQVVQNWGVTDMIIMLSVERFAEAAKKFGDENYAEILEEAKDYRNSMQTLFDKITADYKDSDILPVPLTPNGNDAILFKEYKMPRTRVGHFIKNGFVDTKEVPRVVKWLTDEGLCRNGLYAKMPLYNPHVWYTTAPEVAWMSAFVAGGYTDMAKETLDAILNYTVTTEYYTVERYKDDDIYYTPWMPNASGNARIIDMIFEYYTNL